MVVWPSSAGYQHCSQDKDLTLPSRKEPFLLRREIAKHKVLVATTDKTNVYRKKLKKKKKPTITCSRRLRQEVCHDFATSLGYLVQTGSAWATEKDHFNKRNTNKNISDMLLSQ